MARLKNTSGPSGKLGYQHAEGQEPNYQPELGTSATKFGDQNYDSADCKKLHGDKLSTSTPSTATEQNDDQGSDQIISASSNLSRRRPEDWAKVQFHRENSGSDNAEDKPTTGGVTTAAHKPGL